MIENCLVEETDVAQCKPIDVQNSSLTSAIIDQYKSKLTDYRMVVTSIDSKLDYLQNLTEEVYLRIGNKLPEISQGLNLVENEARRLLEYFERENGFSADTEKNAETSDLRKLNRASKYLIKVADEQGDAFLQMSTMMKRIDNVKDSIESIREFSVEMEMLSLNAAIVAIKAGEAGRTLNPITVELKKMANAAISLIDEIVRNSGQLVDKHSLFQELSEKQAKSCKVDAQNISENLTDKYRELQLSISDLVRRLRQIINIVESSKKPIEIIMNTLQVQDILKQCTDHVRVSLNEAMLDIESLADCVDANHTLDVIAFQEKVPALCIQLLDDIDSRLKDSIGTLADEFKNVQELLDSATGVHDDGSADLADVSLSNVEEAFSGIEDVVMQTALMIQSATQSWEQLWSTAVGLETMFEILEKQFKYLKKLTNFHLINIPIKIEVARSIELSKDGELSERVEGLAEYISTEMKQSHKEINQDYLLLDQLVDSMSKHKIDVEDNLNSIALDVDDLLGNFYRSKEQVKATFSCVHSRSTELGELITAASHDLDDINQLIEQNHRIKTDLEKLVSFAGEARASYQSIAGLESWTLHDERLKNMVNRFTVLAHKKIAESLYDIDVEDGNHEGEITLF